MTLPPALTDWIQYVDNLTNITRIYHSQWANSCIIAGRIAGTQCMRCDPLLQMSQLCVCVCWWLTHVVQGTTY